MRDARCERRALLSAMVKNCELPFHITTRTCSLPDLLSTVDPRGCILVQVLYLVPVRRRPGHEKRAPARGKGRMDLQYVLARTYCVYCRYEAHHDVTHIPLSFSARRNSQCQYCTVVLTTVRYDAVLKQDVQAGRRGMNVSISPLFAKVKKTTKSVVVVVPRAPPATPFFVSYCVFFLCKTQNTKHKSIL